MVDNFSPSEKHTSRLRQLTRGFNRRNQGRPRMMSQLMLAMRKTKFSTCEPMRKESGIVWLEIVPDEEPLARETAYLIGETTKGILFCEIKFCEIKASAEQPLSKNAEEERLKSGEDCDELCEVPMVSLKAREHGKRILDSDEEDTETDTTCTDRSGPVTTPRPGVIRFLP